MKEVNPENKYSPVEDKILAAANDTFIRYGFHGTTIEKIALKAGVNKASIHYYFRTKECIYAIVFKNNLTLVFDFLNNNEIHHNFHFKPDFGLVPDEQQNMTLITWFIINEIRVNKQVVSVVIANDEKANRLISSLFHVTHNLERIEKLVISHFAETIHQNLPFKIPYVNNLKVERMLSSINLYGKNTTDSINYRSLSFPEAILNH